MTSLTFHLSRALGSRLGPGRRDRRHGARPPRQRRHLEGARAGPRRHDPHRPDAAGDRAARRRRISRARSARARSSSRSAGPRTRWARSTTSSGSAAWRATPEPCPSSTPCTPRPTSCRDVERLGCDYLACSPYKFYGPHLGVLWGRRALIEALDVPRLVPAPDWSPERLETGTLSHEGIVGAAAAVDFLASLAGPDSPQPPRPARRRRTTPSTCAARDCSRGCGAASARSRACGSTVRGRRSRALRRSPSSSRARQPTRSPRPSPSGPSISRAATSTPGRWSSAWAHGKDGLVRAGCRLLHDGGRGRPARRGRSSRSRAGGADDPEHEGRARSDEERGRRGSRASGPAIGPGEALIADARLRDLRLGSARLVRRREGGHGPRPRGLRRSFARSEPA